MHIWRAGWGWGWGVGGGGGVGGALVRVAVHRQQALTAVPIWDMHDRSKKGELTGRNAH